MPPPRYTLRPWPHANSTARRRYSVGGTFVVGFVIVSLFAVLHALDG
jgi:hypothetical protein